MAIVARYKKRNGWYISVNEEKKTDNIELEEKDKRAHEIIGVVAGEMYETVIKGKDFKIEIIDLIKIIIYNYKHNVFK